MSKNESKQKRRYYQPIIALTLPTPSEGGIPLERATATLLIQRGDLAHIRQFTYIVMIDIPLKKGTLVVKISYLKIIGGETDAAAYRQAVLIAGKLIDGKLWDDASPIRIDDVYAVEKKMKHLSEREMSLLALEDLVQVGAVAQGVALTENEG